jgi:hypothetical protein
VWPPSRGLGPDPGAVPVRARGVPLVSSGVCATPAVVPLADDDGSPPSLMRPTLRVAVTGARTMPTDRQRRLIRERLRQLTPDTVVVVGCCLGIDAYIARAVFAYCRGVRVHAIVPADTRTADWVDPDWRIWCHSYETMPTGTTNRDRNIRLLESGSTRLLAWPAYPEDHPQSQRSGTWQTIRLGRRRSMPVEVVVLSSVLDT